MVVISIAAAVMAAAFVVLVAFIVPTFIELRKTAQALQDLIRHTDEELKPVLHDLGVAAADLKVVAHVAAERIDDVREMMSAVGEAGRGFRTISTVVGAAAGACARSSAWLSGAKVAGSFIVDRFFKKRG